MKKTFVTILSIFPVNLLAQEVTVEKLLENQSDLISQLATFNLGYLAVAVSVILGSGVMFYLFNVRPLEDKVKKAEEDFNETRIELSNKVDQKIEESEKNFSLIEEDLKKELLRIEKWKNDTELEIMSNDYYTWQIGANNAGGDGGHIFRLIAMEKAIRYITRASVIGTDDNVGTGLDQIILSLNLFEGDDRSKLEETRGIEVFNGIIGVFNITKDAKYETKKTEIIKKATELLLPQKQKTIEK